MTQVAPKPQVQEADSLDDDEVFVVDPSIRARKREITIIWLSRVMLGVGFVVIWQLAAGRLVSTFWISSPSEVWSAIVSFWEQGVLGSAVRVTLVETLVGFAFGAGAGVLVGIALGVNQLVARILDPYLVAFNSIPRVALVPLMILWFGIGFETKVIFSALLVFFPVFMNTIAGARDVDRDLIDVLRVMGASRWAVIRKVLIPSSLTWVFAGLRMSIPFALIGAVMAEMFTSNEGLGYLIALSANQYDTAGTFASLLVTTVLGLLLTVVVSQVERRLLRWQPARR